MEEETQVPFKDYFPKLSLGSYFWMVILISAIIFSVVGYFVGIRVNELPSSTPQPSQQIIPQQVQSAVHVTLMPGDDNDIDYSHISGSIVMNTDAYDQFVVNVNGLPNGKTVLIDTDNRSFVNPHMGIQYPYFFSRLDPFRSYAVTASACRTNPKTYALDCAKNIRITKCTGTIQGNTCVIKGNGIEVQSSGEVDFALGGPSSASAQATAK